MPNKELLQRTLAHIEGLPRLYHDVDYNDEAPAAYNDGAPAAWEQGDWGSTLIHGDGQVCGAAHCFAGWAAILAGFEYIRPITDPDFNPIFVKRLQGIPDSALEVYTAPSVQDLGGMHIADAGGWALGLNHVQRQALFSSKNDLSTLRDLVDRLVNDRSIESIYDDDDD